MKNRPCDLIQLFLPFAPFRASEASWTKRRFFQTTFGRSSIVGLIGRFPTAASSSCLATLLGCDSRKNAEGKSGVGQGVEISGERLAGEEGAGKSDIVSGVSCHVDGEVDASR